MNNLRIIFILTLFACLASGCLSYKQIVNFQDGKTLDKQVDVIKNGTELRIKPDDIISIAVFSFNAEEANRFNIVPTQQMAQTTTSGAGASVSDPYGYRVDSKGEIEMPVIGKIKVDGLTTEEVRDIVTQKIVATGYLTDQNVQVRFLSFRITLLGEVGNPGTYTIPSQKITVLEALGLAKDVTLYSNRDNILVIREKDGLRTYGRLDIKSKEVFNNPFYYLQPNDIVYVEPHRAKILSVQDPVSRYLSIVLGLVSLATIIVAL